MAAIAMEGQHDCPSPFVHCHAGIVKADKPVDFENMVSTPRSTFERFELGERHTERVASCSTASRPFAQRALQNLVRRLPYHQGAIEEPRL